MNSAEIIFEQIRVCLEQARSQLEDAKEIHEKLTSITSQYDEIKSQEMDFAGEQVINMTDECKRETFEATKVMLQRTQDQAGKLNPKSPMNYWVVYFNYIGNVLRNVDILRKACSSSQKEMEVVNNYAFQVQEHYTLGKACFIHYQMESLFSTVQDMLRGTTSAQSVGAELDRIVDVEKLRTLQEQLQHFGNNGDYRKTWILVEYCKQEAALLRQLVSFHSRYTAYMGSDATPTTETIGLMRWEVQQLINNAANILPFRSCNQEILVPNLQSIDEKLQQLPTL